MSAQTWLKNNPPAASLRREPTGFQARILMEVSELACTLAVNRLETFDNNKLSPAHRQAIRRLVVGYSYLASGLLNRRVAYPINVGCGKTASVEAWLAALYQTPEANWGVAVGASQVEALCTIRRNLLDLYNVPVEWSGLWHTLGNKATMPTDDDKLLAHRQGALVTHARVATAYSFRRFHMSQPEEFARIDQGVQHSEKRMDSWSPPSEWHKASAAQRFGFVTEPTVGVYRPRGVIIWDEALYPCDHYAINNLDLDSSLGALGPQIQKQSRGGTAPLTTTRNEAFSFLQQCQSVINAEMGYLDTTEQRTFDFPALEQEDRERYIAAIEGMEYESAIYAPALELLRASHLPTSVIKSNLGGAAISFEVAVDDRLSRIAILDASSQIDRLITRDATITLDPHCPVGFKTFHNLIVNYKQHGAGRSSLMKMGLTGWKVNNESKAETNNICKAVVEVISALPQDEAVLIFSFKLRRVRGKLVDAAAIITTYLEAAGVDLKTTVEAEDKDGSPVQKPRICFSTYGRERSSNEFSYCRNVMLVGILTRSEEEMRSALHASERDLTADIKTVDVADALVGADAVVVHQAAARGNIRQTYGGACGPMKLWLFHRSIKAIRADLERVLPGARWEKWDTAYITETLAKEADVADAISDYLNGLAESVRSVNVPAMRKLLTLTVEHGVSNDTFGRARVAALTQAPSWQNDGQRLIVRKK